MIENPPLASVQIVRSKLRRPRVVADFVVRSELLRLLDAGSELPLTLLSAPAGYGKTSLLVHWLEGRDAAAAWLSLDRDDSEPMIFASYFVAALRSVFPAACAETLACLNASPPPSLATLAGSLSNALEALPAPLVLVLDGYQHVDSPSTQALLDRLLAHPASGLRLVISTRQDPRLSLGALRVREAMVEIRVPDLQFDERASATLIERCAGRAVSGEDLLHLQTCTEGWPVGVRLAALALRNGDDAAAGLARSLSGESPQLQQYFVEELLADQTAGTVDCLLRTSILDRFCAPLCDAVLWEGAALGETLVSQALLRVVSSGAMLCTVIDDGRHWYRYRRLFREFLQRQLSLRCTPADIAELHHRAAAWLATQGLLEEAIPHALAGDGGAAAGQLLARHRNLLLGREQRRRLDRCLRLLPPDTVEGDPELLVMKAWLMYHQGRHVEISAVVDRIEALIDSTVAGIQLPGSEALRGHLLALRSLHAYLEGQAGSAVALAEQALQRLPVACVHAHVTAQALLAGGRQAAGDLAGARDGIRQALAHAAGPIDACQAPLVATLCLIDWMAADLSALQWTADQYYNLGDARFASEANAALGRYFLGLVQYQRNELSLAEATLLPALAPEQAPRLGYRTEMSFLLAAVYQALGQADRARAIVDAVCERLAEKADLPALFRARACQADLALRQGRLAEAQDWARSFDPGPVQFVYRFFSAPHLTLARVWIAEGSDESRKQAARLLQLLEAQLTSRHNVRFLAEALALQALLEYALGDESAAVERLGRALALTRTGGFIRLFVDLGQELVKPLKLLEASIGNARYAGQILAALNDDWLVTAGRQQVGADLTRRELKILKLLAVRLSNIEISEELCISRATVKRHTQNIYRKLRASSRREAVVRARTLNILVDG